MGTLKINGKDKQFPTGQTPSTVAELLQRLDINEATVLAKIGGKIIEREEFERTKLTKEHIIELIRFGGGG